MRDPFLVGVLAAALLTSFASQAQAQAGWAGIPTVLSDRGAGETRLGMDALGNAVAIWTDSRSGARSGDLFGGYYTGASRQWTSGSTGTGSNIAWDLAVDGLGNAIAVGIRRQIVADVFWVLRYDRASGTWTPQPVPIPITSIPAGALVAMNPAGAAVVCWNHPNTSIHCSRYAPATGAWSAGEEVGFSTALGAVAMDSAGVAHVIWTVGSNVRTARVDPNTGSWSAPQDLAVGLSAGSTPTPRLAANAAGQTVATWTRGGALEAARYSPGAGWSGTEVLSATGNGNAAARAAVDPSGVITVAWVHDAPPMQVLQVTRYNGGAWTAPLDVSRPDVSAAGPAALAADAAGNVHLFWRQVAGGRTHLAAAKYVAGPGQWGEAVDVSGPADAVSEPDVAVDVAGNAMAIWAQDLSVRSLRWDPTPSPPVITAVSAAPGALSLSFVLPPTTEPALALSSVDYSIDGGATWAPAALPLQSPLTISGLADGITYDVRMRASNSAGAGRSTDQLLASPGADAAVGNLRVVTRTGNTLTFAWSAPSGVQPSAYVLQGGVVAGQTLATLPVAAPDTNVTLMMPAGVFYLRVAALLPLGTGQISNEIRVAVDAAAPPAAPVHLLGTVNGSHLQLSWTNVVSDSSPTSLTVYVTGSVTGSMPLPVGETLSISGVPPGTYTLTLTASNAAGTSAPSAPVTLTFPGACSGLPAPPAHLSAAVSGGVVTLAWDPPASGPAVSGYVLQVSGATQGALPVAERVLTASPPPGTYIITAAAANACGTGAATPPVVVVVP